MKSFRLLTIFAGALVAAAPLCLHAQTPRPAVPTPQPFQGFGAATPKPGAAAFASLLTGDWALSDFNGLPFALYAAKDLKPGQKYPLVLALHGKSQNNENGKQVTGWMKSFAKPERYQANACIIVAPLCYQPYGGTGSGWGDKPGEQALALVKALAKALPIDPKRIYVAGHSMGGFGVCHLMAREPQLFAAGVAVSGYGGATEEAKLARKPLWLFHAADDKTVPVDGARSFAKLFGKTKTFKYTEYPDGGHGIPGKVFDDDETHKWLFAQGVHPSEPSSLLPPRPAN
jgi:predicted peptidase